MHSNRTRDARLARSKTYLVGVELAALSEDLVDVGTHHRVRGVVRLDVRYQIRAGGCVAAELCPGFAVGLRGGGVVLVRGLLGFGLLEVAGGAGFLAGLLFLARSGGDVLLLALLLDCGGGDARHACGCGCGCGWGCGCLIWKFYASSVDVMGCREEARNVCRCRLA